MAVDSSSAFARRTPRVLFISHDASRTGAPILLLHFLRWLKQTTPIQFEILLRSGGPLYDEFAAVAPTVIWNQPVKNVLGSLKKIGRRTRIARRFDAVDVIYSNTVTNGILVKSLLKLLGRKPVITHVHELGVGIRSFGFANLDAVRQQTTRYIACADAVKTNLTVNHGVPQTAVDVVHEFIRLFDSDDDPARDRTEVRAQWGIPDDAVVVGAAGTVDWRKFPEALLLLAVRVFEQCPGENIHFVWIGGEAAGTRRRDELDHDVRAAGLTDRVHFLGVTNEPLRAFGACDMFALVSREDPFPLVCLEAASVGLPILCFDGAGGEPEFVEDDAGFVVPYMDFTVLADRVIRLARDPALRRTLGENAARKVRERHLVNHSGAKLLTIIESVVESNVDRVTAPGKPEVGPVASHGG